MSAKSLTHVRQMIKMLKLFEDAEESLLDAHSAANRKHQMEAEIAKMTPEHTELLSRVAQAKSELAQVESKIEQKRLTGQSKHRAFMGELAKAAKAQEAALKDAINVLEEDLKDKKSAHAAALGEMTKKRKKAETELKSITDQLSRLKGDIAKVA